MTSSDPVAIVAVIIITGLLTCLAIVAYAVKLRRLSP